MANRATGKVTRLYANRHGTFIQLDVDPTKAPKGEYFRLQSNHANYNGLYSLALAAAANRWPLTIRIEGDGEIDPNFDANIDYLVVDWKAGSATPD